MNWTLRRADERDLLPVDALLKAAFGSRGSFRPTLMRCLRLQPDGWWVAQRDQAILGLGGAVDYEDLAYIGLMGVHPQVQGQGLGRRILSSILEWLDHKGCPLVVLDATPAGLPLYRSLGFVETEQSLTYTAAKLSPSLDLPSTEHQIRSITVSDFEQITHFDHLILGANRGRLLRPLLWEYLERSLIAVDGEGKIMGVLLAQMDTLGPWMATDPQIAEILLGRALRLPFGSYPRLYAPGCNPEIPDLMARWGFQQRQLLAHMQRGASTSVGRRADLYGMINYALG